METMTQLPKTVKVGSYVIPIKFEKGMITDDDRCGSFNSRTMEINIDPDLCPELQYGVFCHEVIEAIKEIYSIDCLKQDHHPINQLGEALHQFLRDNGKEILPE